jgi:hypothetical protein
VVSKFEFSFSISKKEKKKRVSVLATKGSRNLNSQMIYFRFSEIIEEMEYKENEDYV